jgi:hypothetical protein
MICNGVWRWAIQNWNWWLATVNLLSLMMEYTSDMLRALIQVYEN